MEIPYTVTPRKDTGLFNSKIGLWLFLASEIMLFGGLFSGYIFLRIGADYPWPERTIPVIPGLINTFILILSSVTVVFAWAALKMRNWKQYKLFMGATLVCAITFLGFKAVEYNVKFHHQAARLADFVILEGHADHEKDADGNEVRNAKGKLVEMNLRRFQPTEISYNLAGYYKPWVENLLAEAKENGVKIELAKDMDFNPKGESKLPTFKAGEELSLSLLNRIAKAEWHNRASNSRWRTDFLRKAWKEAKAQPDNALSRTNFAAEFPQGLSMNPSERDKAFTRWKAGKRSRMAQDVNLELAVLKHKGEQVRYDDVKLPEIPHANFKVSGGDKPFTMRMRSIDIRTKYKEGLDNITLRDGTKLIGKQGDSTLVFHNVDGIDFQYLVMRAIDKGQEPEIAIEKSWLYKNNKDVAKLWELHQEATRQLAEELVEKYGYQKDGVTPKRVPTHKDLYRMNWQEIAHYGELAQEKGGLENVTTADVKIKPGTFTPPVVSETVKEHFTGPDYNNRHFITASVPRAQVNLASKFKPHWNTYYAIYFTITGIHAIHIIGGIIVLGYFFFFGHKLYLKNPEWMANRVEVAGLFWHFVDIIWIFAFPIFYLM